MSKSSTKLEYRSLALSAVELVWGRMLVRDLGISLKIPPIIYCDNINAIALPSNPIFHAHTKHIDIVL